jgi:acyl carrier protein
MTTTSAAISQNAITGVVHRMLKQRSIDRQALPEEDLRDVGLSSLDMIELVLSVESELDLTIPEAAITPRNFRSIAAIDALVTALQA